MRPQVAMIMKIGEENSEGLHRATTVVLDAAVVVSSHLKVETTLAIILDINYRLTGHAVSIQRYYTPNFSGSKISTLGYLSK